MRIKLNRFLHSLRWVKLPFFLISHEAIRHVYKSRACAWPTGWTLPFYFTFVTLASEFISYSRVELRFLGGWLYPPAVGYVTYSAMKQYAIWPNIHFTYKPWYDRLIDSDTDNIVAAWYSKFEFIRPNTPVISLSPLTMPLGQVGVVLFETLTHGKLYLIMAAKMKIKKNVLMKWGTLTFCAK